jgi:hypothetical protein
LKEIWERYPEVSAPLPPLYQEKVRNQVITFLSLNPSIYSKDKKIIEAREGNELSLSYKMVDCKVPARDCPQHFRKFYEIGKTLDKPWTAIDLLYIRNSDQKKIKQLGNSLFIAEQMKLTFELLSFMNPKIVVVSNGTVDELIHKNKLALNLEMKEPNQDNGYTYFINDIPFIIKESRYISNRRLWYSSVEKKQKLFEEIRRVMPVN